MLNLPRVAIASLSPFEPCFCKNPSPTSCSLGFSSPEKCFSFHRLKTSAGAQSLHREHGGCTLAQSGPKPVRFARLESKRNLRKRWTSVSAANGRIFFILAYRKASQLQIRYLLRSCHLPDTPSWSVVDSSPRSYRRGWSRT